MDWSSERYVRLYVRDTDDWLSLSWQAQGLLPQLLRKATRSGVIATRRGAKGVAVLTRWPLDVVEPALAELLADGVLVACEGGYALPNFIDAQEAVKGDALRSREKRERLRDHMLRGADTNRGGSDTNRGGADTNRGGSDTTRHEVTRGDTPYRTVPNQPYSAEVSDSGKPEVLALDIGEQRSRAGNVPTHADVLAAAAVAEINRLAGTRYRADSAELMRNCAVLAKGRVTATDVARVTAVKWAEWGPSDKMRAQFKPGVLLRPSNFRRYQEDIAAGAPMPGGKLLELKPSVTEQVVIDGVAYDAPAEAAS